MTTKGFHFVVSVETDEGEMLILVEWSETADGLRDFEHVEKIAGVDAEMPPEYPSLDNPKAWVRRVLNSRLEFDEVQL